jgi:hypothetical protein
MFTGAGEIFNLKMQYYYHLTKSNYDLCICISEIDYNRTCMYEMSKGQ